MLKKLATLALAVTLVISITSTTNVKAETKASSNTTETNSDLQKAQVSTTPLNPESLPNQKSNVMDRKGSDTLDLNQSSNVPSNNANSWLAESKVAATTGDNSNVNYAIPVADTNVVQDTLSAAGGMKWYKFTLTQKSKSSIYLQLAQTLDADIYVYSLNTQTYQLQLIGGSATTGVGVTEYYTGALDAGTYYFSISDYEGSGNFAFEYFESTADITNEPNDSIGTATNIAFDTTVTGVIDNPNDIDYYSFTIDTPMVIKCPITSTDGYTLSYVGKTGDSAKIYGVSQVNHVYKVFPGTYYFAVLSSKGNFSSTSTYSVQFEKIGDISTDTSLTNIFYSKREGKMIYQTSADGTLNYVNGHKIDISYTYKKNLVNSAGIQKYDISIDPTVSLIGTNPVGIMYYSSTRPAMENIQNQHALMLTLSNNSIPFYKVHCFGSGAYEGNTCDADFNAVTVAIDPESGKLIDIIDFNYFYDFAPVGSNKIIWARVFGDMLSSDNS